MLKIFHSNLMFFTIPVLFVSLFFYGCDDSVESSRNNISFSVTTSNSLNKVMSDSISIDTAKILIRDLKIKSSDDSADIKIGPFVLYLITDGSVNSISVNDIPAASYRSVEFRIHKLENSEVPPDPDFKDSPDDRYSVIVKGTYHNTPFIYKSEKSAKQKVDFIEPVVVGDDNLINVTLVVTPYSWFYQNGQYLDPLDSINTNNIDNLIKDSFKIFKDNNKDGQPD